MTDDALAAGTVISGKYRVERVLAIGGMATVIEATHLSLEKPVALKVLHRDYATSPWLTMRFLREARICARLRPDHIAQVTDVGETDGLPYLVMELLPGRDLFEELSNRGRLPLAQAVDYVLQACEGLAEAHAVGLVHRDLKPANLFLTSRHGEPVVKVLDFGLSKEPHRSGEEATATNVSFGTPEYMAPEQIACTKSVDARCDQHAMGLILYELVAGRRAYDSPNAAMLAYAIGKKPPAPLRRGRPDIPTAFEAVVLRALEKTPEKRFLDLGSFAAALAPFGSPAAAASARRIAWILAAPSDAPARVSLPRISQGPLTDVDDRGPTRMSGLPAPLVPIAAPVPAIVASPAPPVAAPAASPAGGGRRRARSTASGAGPRALAILDEPSVDEHASFFHERLQEPGRAKRKAAAKTPPASHRAAASTARSPLVIAGVVVVVVSLALGWAFGRGSGPKDAPAPAAPTASAEP